MKPRIPSFPPRGQTHNRKRWGYDPGPEVIRLLLNGGERDPLDMERSYRRLVRRWDRILELIELGAGLPVPMPDRPDVIRLLESENLFRLPGMAGMAAVTVGPPSKWGCRLVWFHRGIPTFDPPEGGFRQWNLDANIASRYSRWEKVLPRAGLPVDVRVVSWTGQPQEGPSALAREMFYWPMYQIIALATESQRKAILRWLNHIQEQAGDMPAITCQVDRRGGALSKLLKVYVGEHHMWPNLVAISPGTGDCGYLALLAAIPWWPRRCRRGMLGYKLFRIGNDGFLMGEVQTCRYEGAEIVAHHFDSSTEVHGVAGIHAMHLPIMLPKAGRIIRDPACLLRIWPPYYRDRGFHKTAVALTIHSGHIVYGRCGLRSEYARILALAVPRVHEQYVAAIQSRYNVPVGVC